MGLGDLGQRARARALDHLQHMEARARAHELAQYLAALESLDRIDEQIGQALDRTQADHTALLLVTVFGVFLVDLGEVLTRQRGLERSFSARVALRHLLDAGIVRHRDQHLLDIELATVGEGLTALVEPSLDLGVGDADATLHFMLAHTLRHHLVAQVLAEALQVHAVGLEALDQLGLRQLVLRGHIGHHAVELGLVDLVAVFTRKGDHGALVDHRVERLFLQLFGAGLRTALGAGLLTQLLHAGGHLTGGHDVLVHHGCDVVAGQQLGLAAGHDGFGMLGKSGRRGRSQGADKNEGAERRSGHGSQSELVKRSALNCR